MSNSKISALTLATTPLAGTETLPIVQGGANRQVSVANLAGGITHNNLAGLTTGDPHTQYAFLAGRVGNQTLIGGTAASGTLTLQSTSNATRGKILFGTSAYDEVNNRLGLGTASPRGPLDVVANAPSVFQRDNSAIAAIHSYYNANTTDGNGSNWTFYGDTTGTGAAALQVFGQWDLRLDVHDHATRSSSALFRNYVNGASNIWLWGSSNGNVGISTAAAPSFSLSFGNATDRTISINATGSGTAGRFLDISGGNTSAGGSNIAGGTLFLDSGLGTGTGASNVIFRTGDGTTSGTALQTATERMRINNAGDVGIGTTSPAAQARLQIVKTITPTLTGVVNGFNADISATGHSSGGTDARTFNLLMTTSGANNMTSQFGAFVNASNNLDATKVVAIHYAFAGGPRIIGAGGSTNMGGFYVQPVIQATGSGAVTNYHAFRSVGWNYAGGATTTIANAYGLYLESLYNLGYSAGAWGVYQVGANDNNYFAGKVSIGTTSNTEKVEINGTTRVFGAAYIEGTTVAGVYMGSPSADNPRVMWADGTGNNWQIDVTGNLMRWIIPGYNMMRLQDVSAGAGDAILTLWQQNVAYLTVNSATGFTFNADTAPAGGYKLTTSAVSGAGGIDFATQAGSSTAGTSNAAGGTLYLDAGRGTGSGASNLILRTGASTGTATALQTATTRLTINNAGDFTFFDGADFILGTTTGTKIGTATTQKIGFYNATPIVRPSAYTQTYSTADKTMAARTAAALTDNTGGTVSTTLAAITAGATYTQADMVAVKNAIASLADQMNKSRNDSLDIAQVVNAIIDDLQALGLVG